MNRCIKTEELIECTHFPCRASGVVRFLIICMIAGSAAWAYAATPPADFPQGRKIEVPQGAPLRTIAENLKSDGLIRSSMFFEGFVRMLGGDTGARAGTYFFEQELSVFRIAERLTRGIFGLNPVRVTIPEGATTQEVAMVLARALPHFPKDAFLNIALDKEGYLFPDTYFFLEDTPVEQIVADMRQNFRKHLAPYRQEISDSDLTEEELITLASLLEKEARKSDERHVISGIVRNRLEKNMPLQIDATFRYILGKGSFDLTKKDLHNDSPYNTYTNKGLPPGPIANPGMDSILAALEPKSTKYIFYLHDMTGHIRYATTFAQHRENKFAYLP